MTVTTFIDWASIRNTIDLAAVATRLLGPARGRRGERGRRLWWHCPFHEDRNPSFSVMPGKSWWRCYGCGANGDAVALARRLNPSMSFVEAVAYLTGGSTPTIPTSHRSTPAIKPRVATSAEPSGMTVNAALALVADAEQRLWTPAGFGPAGLDYLHRRGLTDETIRGARLGYAEALSLPGSPRGIVIPWFDGGRLALVKLRQPDGRKPKYREVFRDRPALYPGRHVIRPGHPLIIVEGEFDAVLVGQVLGELAPVVTLGSASSRPVPGILGTMLAATPWYIATDGDEAGDKAAAGWPSSARRVRPPGAFKDWTVAHLSGVNLARWWADRLGGNESPALFAWEELSTWRWGPGCDDPTPGLDIGKTNQRQESGVSETEDTCSGASIPIE
jgi:DNA primase